MGQQSKVLSTIVGISGQVDPSVAKSAKSAIDSLEGINLKAVAVTAAFAALSAGMVVGVKKGAEALFDLGKTAKNAENIITQTTGATGERLEELSDVYKNVYKDGFGESMEAVATDISTISNATNLAGDDLEAAAKNAYLLADAYGYEVSSSAKSASMLMKNFGIEADEAYGLMAAGAQYGADINGDMLDIISEYSGQFADLGLSSDQFMSSLLTASEDGLFSLDKVGDAVKEFNIRSKDGSDASADAFSALGYNADEMFSTFAAGGEGAEAAFFDVVNSLNELEDPLKRNQLGVALFGSQFEDLGDGILPVLADMETGAINSESALGKLNGMHFSDIGTSIDSMKRTAMMAFEPLGSELMDSVSEIMPILMDSFQDLMPVIENLATSLVPFISELSDELIPIIEEIVPIIADLAGDLISTLLPPIMEIVKKVLPPLLRVIKALLPLLDPLIQLLEPILSIFIALLDPVLWLIDNALTPLIAVFSKFINQVLPPLIDILQNVLIPIFSSGLKSAIEGLQPVIDSILGIFQGITDFLGNVFAGNWEGAWQNIVDIFGNIFNSLVELVKMPINFIANAINGMIDGINGIQIPDWVPGIGGAGFDIPKVPLMASGGFTDGVSIAGEAGTEAVISFDPKYRDQNIGYWQEAGRMLRTSDGGSENYSKSDNRVITVTFAPQILIQKDVSAEEIIQKIKEQFSEFKDVVIDAIERGGDENYEPAEIY